MDMFSNPLSQIKSSGALDGEDESKEFDAKHQSKSGIGEGSVSPDEHNNEEDPSSQKKKKKSRVFLWSKELQDKFIEAVNQLGLETADPDKIVELMNVEGLPRGNVQGLLLKYRNDIKRNNCVATHPATMYGGQLGVYGGQLRSLLAESGRFSTYGGQLRSLAGSGRLSNAASSSCTTSGMLGTLNSQAGLSITGKRSWDWAEHVPDCSDNLNQTFSAVAINTLRQSLDRNDTEVFSKTMNSSLLNQLNEDESKEFESKHQNKSGTGEDGVSRTVISPDEHNNEEDPSRQKKKKKSRVFLWSKELQDKFIEAVNQLGLETADPDKIVELMNVEGLPRGNVQGLLLKYRDDLKRNNCVATHPATMLGCSRLKDSSYLCNGPLGTYGGLLRSLAGSGRLSNAASSSCTTAGMLGTLSSSTINTPVSDTGIPGPLSRSLGRNDTVFSKTMNSSLLNQLKEATTMNSLLLNQLGLERANPDKIIELIKVEGLSTENVASHLMNYRIARKKNNCLATNPATMVASDKHICPLDGFGGLRSLSLAGSGDDAIMKRGQNENMLPDRQFGSEACSLGSCT